MKLSRALRFISENAEYVTIERKPDGFVVSIGGDEWEGVVSETEGATIKAAVREMLRAIESADRKRAKEARRVRRG